MKSGTLHFQLQLHFSIVQLAMVLLQVNFSISLILSLSLAFALLLLVFGALKFILLCFKQTWRQTAFSLFGYLNFTKAGFLWVPFVISFSFSIVMMMWWCYASQLLRLWNMWLGSTTWILEMQIIADKAIFFFFWVEQMAFTCLIDLSVISFISLKWSIWTWIVITLLREKCVPVMSRFDHSCDFGTYILKLMVFVLIFLERCRYSSQSYKICLD